MEIFDFFEPSSGVNNGRLSLWSLHDDYHPPTKKAWEEYYATSDFDSVDAVRAVEVASDEDFESLLNDPSWESSISSGEDTVGLVGELPQFSPAADAEERIAGFLKADKLSLSEDQLGKFKLFFAESKNHTQTDNFCGFTPDYAFLCSVSGYILLIDSNCQNWKAFIGNDLHSEMTFTRQDYLTILQGE